MNKPVSSILYNRISKSLLNNKWLEKHGFSKSFIKSHLERANFRADINTMVDKQDYSCTTVWKLSESMINELYPDIKSMEEWLKVFYQYCLCKAFPHTSNIVSDELLSKASILYLKLLRIVSEEQKHSRDNTFYNQYPLSFLSFQEQSDLEDPSEYMRFINAFKSDNIYELMKLGSEYMGYNTIDHVCGVHYLALHIGRQLKSLGQNIDLGRVSGAAASHDIGKFGCKENELKKAPVLHYYYTDLWLRNKGLTYIKHIAVNHSTWDLELENLPLESLILIYSDFRVKNKSHGDGSHTMHIYDLDESFFVILDKLQNVDDNKLKRYKRVYSKLKDFENFLIHSGVNIDPQASILESNNIIPKTFYSLLHGNEIIENIKHLSINHNINIMYMLRDEASLNNILEQARSEKNWFILRTYLRIFEVYSIYLTQKQKLITLKFLYDQLMHAEDDIRKHSAELIGQLIATFDENYRKEIPDEAVPEKPDMTGTALFKRYLEDFINPSHKIIPLHQTWIGYSLNRMVKSLFSHCKKEQKEAFTDEILNIYKDCNLQHFNRVMYKLEAAKFIPSAANIDKSNIIYNYAIIGLSSDNDIIRLSSAELCYVILSEWKDKNFANKIKQHISLNIFYSSIPAENYIMHKICYLLGVDETCTSQYNIYCKEDEKKIPDIFLNNLKSATEWIIKKINIDILLDYAMKDSSTNGLHTALHFCNILKVSYWEIVRNDAGEALIRLLPKLSPEQRNEVAVELLRALEIDGYKYAEYIPQYLGQLILALKPIELDELIQDLSEKIKLSSSQLNTLLLRTVGIAIINYQKYISIYQEDKKIYSDRLVKLVGIILNGIGHYDNGIKQIAFKVLGNDIFGSTSLDLIRKYEIFKLTAKKVLTLIPIAKSDDRFFLTGSVGMQSIYRFISDYVYYYGQINIPIPEKIAFFPGTFDPFSLSHKQIARTIRDQGFEVYLAVDEFSWSKQTLPHLLRSSILNMSIADESGMYLYPEEYPIDMSNSENLSMLKDSFKDLRVYIVAGSDVIMNASAYKKEKSDNSIHSFPHIIFQRERIVSQAENKNFLDNMLKNIDADIIRLSLLPQYEDISSTQIRSNIDENRDISILIDPLVQKYIYENGFYQRQPTDKALLQTISVDINIISEVNYNLLTELNPMIENNPAESIKALAALLDKTRLNILLLNDINRKNKPLGFVIFHRTDVSNLFRDFGDAEITQYIRENSVGHIVVIDALISIKDAKIKNLNQILLTEALSYCLSKGFEYGIYRGIIQENSQEDLYEILRLQGFINVPSSNNKKVFCVNMSSPCVLNLDLQTVVKDPIRSSNAFQKILIKTRSRLQQALTELYKGHLVLYFDRNILHETLIRKICRENNVPIEPQIPRILGSCMCVPFGNILNNSMIPNTVTKSLHTEKFFNPDMKGFTIGAFPFYLDLKSQVRMIQSFKRPVILVDDLLNKGYRIKALDPILNGEKVQVQKTIVGILSARGKEIMNSQNREVDCAYYIPKLRLWFNENNMYPFIGGDALWRGSYPERNLLPSINYILPYVSPSFMKSTSKEAIYHLSEVSIENSIDILTALEKEYQDMYERKLTLSSMGHVFTMPRCPDQGENIEYDLNINPSHYLKNDLELLRRLKNFLE